MADEQQNVNQPQKGGIRASSFFAGEQKRKEEITAAAVQAATDALGREQKKEEKQKSLSRRMEDAVDNIELDKSIRRRLGVVVFEMEKVQNNLVEMQKQLQSQTDSLGKNEGEEKRRQRKETDEIRRVRGALFDIRGILSAWSAVNLLEAFKSGDMNQVGANAGGILTLLAPEIFNIVSNTVTGILIGYGLIRGGGKTPKAPAPRSAPSIPGAGKLGFITRAMGVLSLLGGGAFLGSQLTKKDDLEERLAELGSDQRTVIGGLPEEEINRFSNILMRFEEAVDRLLGTRKPRRIETISAEVKPPPGGLGEPGSPYPDGKVPDFSEDVEFLEKVRLMSKKLNVKPSELLSMLSKESSPSIDPKAKNKSGATGIFQLMYNPDDAQQKRYGYTREEFLNLSRAQQMDVYDQYLQDVQKQFKKYPANTLDLGLSQLAPALMGAEEDTTIYRSGTAAYTQNQGIDSDADGRITAGELRDYMMGNVEKYKKYDQTLLDLDTSTQYKQDLADKIASTTFLPLDLSGTPATPGPDGPLVASNNENEFYSTTNPDTHLALFYQSQYNLMGA